MEQPETVAAVIKVWVDAQLSPIVAKWLQDDFDIEAHSVKSLGLLAAKDEAIFFAARQENAIILTKDIDLKILLDRFGPPPKIIRLTLGNTANSAVRSALQKNFDFIIDYLIKQDQSYIEITD